MIIKNTKKLLKTSKKEKKYKKIQNRNYIFKLVDDSLTFYV